MLYVWNCFFNLKKILRLRNKNCVQVSRPSLRFCPDPEFFKDFGTFSREKFNFLGIQPFVFVLIMVIFFYRNVIISLNT